MTNPAVARVLSILRSSADIAPLEKDEHLRFALYNDALSSAAPEVARELLEAILADRDRAMAESSVAMYIDRMGETSTTDSFELWTASQQGIFDASPFLNRRIQEWRLRRAARDGTFVDASDLVGSSDWLQRAVSEEATSTELLEVLANQGRTKRIRATASRRLPR
jgi:hypothetical protein